MNFKRMIIGAAMALGMAMSLSACVGETVKPGEVGVMTRQVGANAGVDPKAVTGGWHMTWWGEKIVLYPVVQKTFPYQDIQLADNTGLPIAADVAITIQVTPSKAPELYKRYRLDQDQLINGPVLQKTRAVMRKHLAKYTSEQLYQGKDQVAIAEAQLEIAKHYEKEGINILSLDLVGRLKYPESVVNAIANKTKLLQEAEAAKANEIKATAEANAEIARAKGQAEATRIRGEALRTNPQILQQEWIAKWDGVVPSTVVGDNTMMMVQPK